MDFTMTYMNALEQMAMGNCKEATAIAERLIAQPIPRLLLPRARQLLMDIDYLRLKQATQAIELCDHIVAHMPSMAAATAGQFHGMGRLLKKALVVESVMKDVARHFPELLDDGVLEVDKEVKMVEQADIDMLRGVLAKVTARFNQVMAGVVREDNGQT